MNRDTLYSSGVFDLDAGPVTITLPEGAAKRFMSMQAVSGGHYTGKVYYGGRHTYTRAGVSTRYVNLLLRTFVNVDDPSDLAGAHALQSAVKVEQA